jgi:ABC-type antimicrobial peptide transport system permease subunit
VRKDTVLVDQRYQVIGVVNDSRWLTVARREPGRMLYRPLGDPSMPGASTATLLVRTERGATGVAAAIRGAVAALAPAMPVTVATMTERVDRTLGEQRLFATVVSLLTILAVSLAAVGLYALIAFSVAERRKEFGLRIALGAQGREILNHVALQGAVLAGIGTVLGLAGAVALSRAVASRLFGITPLEPHVYLLATSFMALLAVVASLVPAWAATRVDPMVALRSE